MEPIFHAYSDPATEKFKSLRKKQAMISEAVVAKSLPRGPKRPGLQKHMT